MVDSGDKGAPEGLMMEKEVEEALRYAADEPFPADRLEKNGQIIEDRIQFLDTRQRQLVPRGRLLRVAVITGTIIGLFSVGSSALFIFNKYFDADTVRDNAAETESRKTAARLGPTVKRKAGQLMAEENTPEQIPDPPIVPHAPKENMEVPAHRIEKTPKSVLDRQLNLFKAAKGLVEHEQYSRALSKLELLDKKYPGGPLDIESKVLRAKCLVHMGRFNPAERLVDTLVRGSHSNRKKAELLRFLGDIQVQLGRCDSAVKSYRRALGLGLRAADSRAAKNGIAKFSVMSGLWGNFFGNGGVT
jgi:TolA-binding protein